MISGRHTTWTIAQLGKLNRGPVENAIRLANRVQRPFYFMMQQSQYPMKPAKYRLPNRGFDCDAAIADILARSKAPQKPVLFVTGHPYSDDANGSHKGYFYLADYALGGGDDAAIVSTYLWDGLPGARAIQQYILFNLAVLILSSRANLEIHSGAGPCLFDYCEDPKDLLKIMRGAGLCAVCEQLAYREMRDGRLAMEDFAGAIKLYHRAINRRTCFIAMPFSTKLDLVYKSITDALVSAGWFVKRADEIPKPRTITTSILHAILTSDLVVADLTGNNPNVFYELGLAHMAGCDVIMITQEARIPFDLSIESAIFYKHTARGRAMLSGKLVERAGTCSALK